MNRQLVIAFLFLFPLTALSQKDSIKTRVILIGDAGSLVKGSPSVLNAVKRSYPLNEKTVVVFLGDNLYDYGLPDETYNNYSDIKAALDSQINLVRGTKARSFFIPGNHDWQNGGASGYQNIVRQQSYVDAHGGSNVQFFPKEGCPGPVAVDIADDVVLVMMDSQWWLHTNDKPGIESDCDYKTEEEVLSELEDILNKNFRKLVILATHHPFKSNGPHGGYYTWKQHIFPFTDMNKSLYIPLPVLGSVYPITRSVFGSPQDIKNPRYTNMVSRISEVVKTHPHVIMVSGHEHNLELLRDSSYYYIISGSGCKTNRVSPGRKAVYTARELGFAELDISKNKNVKANFFIVDPQKTDSLKQTFSADLINYGNLPPIPKEDTVKATYVYKDFVKSAASSQYKELTGLKRFFNGVNYRREWSVPVTLKVFNINKEHGGFKIDGLGGGKQTKSLGLIDKNGKEWALRTIDKDPEKAIPENFRNTFASGIIQDMISAGHPYAPMAVAMLADSAGIIESDPEFFYVPDDPSLGYYRPLFANKVCLLERKDPDYNNDSKSSYKIFDKMREENDHTVDQLSVLNARLLDMMIGDWDRHFDQWKFAPRDTGKGKVYIPIPRDRDQAFFNSDGFLIKFISRKRLPFLKGLKPTLPDINHLNAVAKDFDRLFMNGIDQHQWDSVANSFTQKMNDDVITKAVKQLPPEVYALSGEKITKNLIARKNLLHKRSLEYYKFISQSVNILGSNQKEIFKLEAVDDKLKVIVYSHNKEADTSFVLYRRIFDPSVTKEIRLYGFNDDDQFIIDTNIHSPIHIRMIGGRGNDSFIVKSPAKAYAYDNLVEKNYLQKGSRTKQIFENDPAINDYQLKGFNYPIVRFPRVVLGYNADDGVLVGTGFWFRNFKFRRDPFANDHKLNALAAITRKAYQIKYSGSFNKLIGKNDVLINATVNLPGLNNFFGFGNNTTIDKTKRISYYRVRYRYQEVDLLLQRRKFDKLSIYAGPSFYAYQNEYEHNKNYILGNPSLVKIDSANIYQNKIYAGVKAGVNVNNLNNELFPTRGIEWNNQFTYLKGFNSNSNSLTKIESNMTVYASLKIPAKVVGVIKLGGGKIFNDSLQFFQALYLGQNNILRGFRKNRFAGHSLAYGSLELRVKLFDSKSYFFPGQVGLIAFDDVGRVWYKGENSKRWHNTYGAGLYFIPFNLTIVSATMGISDDGKIFNFSIGTKFNLTF